MVETIGLYTLLGITEGALGREEPLCLRPFSHNAGKARTPWASMFKSYIRHQNAIRELQLDAKKYLLSHNSNVKEKT